MVIEQSVEEVLERPTGYPKVGFESRLRRFFTPTPAESLPNLNPAFLLSASRPFNRWPSVWFGSMLYGISMRPKYPGYWRRRALMTNDGKPSLLPLHFKLSSLDGAQVVAANAAQRPAWAPSTIYTQHSIYRSPDRKRT